MASNFGKDYTPGVIETSIPYRTPPITIAGFGPCDAGGELRPQGHFSLAVLHTGGGLTGTVLVSNNEDPMVDEYAPIDNSSSFMTAVAARIAGDPFLGKPRNYILSVGGFQHFKIEFKATGASVDISVCRLGMR